MIIVGGGIAGTGLAYNLSKICPEKSVLLIEKNEFGGNASYGYRNTFKKIVDEYNLPVIKKYRGMHLGTKEEILLTLKENFYFIDYTNACKRLFNNSQASLFKGEAKNIINNTIVTDSNKFAGKYIIDCSGTSFFSKSTNIPQRYWIGKVNKIKANIRDKKYCYHLLDETGYLEDFYPLDDYVLQGDWAITNVRDFSKIKSKKTLCKDLLLENSKILESHYVSIPCFPSIPIVKNNIACLGDSFGNATTSSAEGIRPILDSSKILAASIKKDDLTQFQKLWMKTYLKKYMRDFFMKKNPKIKLDILKALAKYPDVALKLFQGKHAKIPYEVKKTIPKNYLVKSSLGYIKNMIQFKIRSKCYPL